MGRRRTNLTTKEKEVLKKLAKDIKEYDPSKEDIKTQEKEPLYYRLSKWICAALLIPLIGWAISITLKGGCFSYYASGYCLTNKSCLISYLVIMGLVIALIVCVSLAIFAKLKGINNDYKKV